ncbi:MAG: YlxR family protein [Actinomycetota bacterium]
MSARPIRTCAGCRTRRPQPELIRVAHRPDGSVRLDVSGRAAGRGAYVCADRRCIERACRTGSLRRSLRYEGSLPETLEETLRRRVLELEKGRHG